MQIERDDGSALMFKREVCGIQISGKKGLNKWIKLVCVKTQYGAKEWVK
jgi:hypothetical protein